MTYTEWLADDKSIAGMIEMSPNYPEGTPSHWATYFAVADLDATMARAQSLGATVLIDSMDSPPGRFGMILDPQGAALSLIQLTETA
ncbi:VOC family protein [Nonomuraea dietziae]